MIQGNGQCVTVYVLLDGPEQLDGRSCAERKREGEGVGAVDVDGCCGVCKRREVQAVRGPC